MLYKSSHQLRRYYRAMLSEVAIRYGLNKDDLHEMLKVGYHIPSTTLLDYEWRIRYVDQVHYFIACVFDMYFDTDGYKYESVSFTRLFDTMRPCVSHHKPINHRSLF